MFRTFSIRSKLLLLVLPTIITSMLILSVLVVVNMSYMVRHEMTTMKNVSLNVLGYDLAKQYQALGIQTLTDNSGNITSIMWDAIPDLTDNEVVDFSALQTSGISSVILYRPELEKFVRVSTSANPQSGKRNIGSALNESHETALRDLPPGEILSITFKIDSQEYFSRILPIRTSSGEITGAIESSIPKSELSALLRNKILLCILATIGVTVAATTTLSILIPRLMQPIRDVNSAMQEIISGSYDSEIPHKEIPDPIGDIARSLETFGDALKRNESNHDARILAQEEITQKATAQAELQKRVVNELTMGLKRMAAGDLSQPIESPAHAPFPSDYEDLRSSYNDVLHQMGTAISKVIAAAGNVESGAGEIDQAAEDLAARAETQAATLEESAAALNQLSESVRRTSDRAEQAEASGRGTREQAESGAQVMKEAIGAMRQIEHSSENVNRIIGAIDDIAFQTNLLALNAGVEAARAGEAGKGFAVVASEVRGLAQRASESAREIKSLIAKSSSQVKEGSRLVATTGERLDDILDRAKEMQELMSEIAEAAREQSSGLNEISDGVNQLDGVTQQNAAMAEQTNAAASSLSATSRELVGILEKFRLSGHEKRTTRFQERTTTRLDNSKKPNTNTKNWAEQAMNDANLKELVHSRKAQPATTRFEGF